MGEIDMWDAMVSVLAVVGVLTVASAAGLAGVWWIREVSAARAAMGARPVPARVPATVDELIMWEVYRLNSAMRFLPKHDQDRLARDFGTVAMAFWHGRMSREAFLHNSGVLREFADTDTYHVLRAV